jgi:exodeoxyribonuclease-3
MRIVSFNVNGIRARPHQLEALRDKYAPDIIGLQETKVQDADFPREMVERLGYQVIYYGQKSHYGVALLAKVGMQSHRMGLPSDDDEAHRRLITATYTTANGESVTVINGYFPQGESRDHPTKFPHKERFYAELQDLLQEQHSPQDNLLVIGDMNIAPIDKDIGIGDANAKRWLRDGKTSFLPEEREWLARLQSWGLYDAYREKYPAVDDQFSWFDYRSKGFDREPKRGLRIDLLLASDALRDKITDAGIAHDIRSMEKPSDHAPVWVDIDV